MRWATRTARASGVAIALLGCGREILLGGPATDGPPTQDAGSIASSGAGAASGVSATSGSAPAGNEGGASGATGAGANAGTSDSGAIGAATGAATSGGTADGGVPSVATGDASVGPPVVEMATLQCDNLTSALCTSSTQCTTGTDVADCESQLGLEFGCPWASGVDYSSCLQDGRTLGCGALFPDGGLTLPASCLPPITATPLSDAQTQCYALVDALCAQSLACAGDAPTSLDVQNCEDDVTTDLPDGIPCLLASTVGSGYADCLAAISSLACTDAGSIAGAGADAAAADGSTPITAIPSCASAIGFAP
jgi:hypothetical protein